MTAGDQVLLWQRQTGVGFDVVFRPQPVASRLLGRGVDDAEAVVANAHLDDAAAHRIAFARAWAGVRPTDARCAAWSLRLLAERVRNEANRAAAWFVDEAERERLAMDVVRAERALVAAVGLAGSARSGLSPDRGAVADAAGRLEVSFSALVDAMRPAAGCGLAGDACALVAAARAGPPALLARLRLELPALLPRLADDPPLPLDDDAAGIGSAVTVGGRVTYGLRIAAGFVSAAGCTTPSERLFKPGGVAAEFLLRFAGDARNLGLVLAALDPSLSWTLLGAVADA